MKKRMMLTVLLVVGLAGLVACGSSDSETVTADSPSADSPTLDSVTDLPKATDPVVSAVTGDIAKGAGIAKTAVTGIKLSDIADNKFNASSSVAACEMSNNLREIFNASAQADMIQCYVAQTFAASDQSVDIYDGNWHVIGLTAAADDPNGPDKVKIRIVKTGGTITSFEMFACGSGSQKEYLGQTITDSAVETTGVGIFSDAGGSGAHYVHVAGALNADGHYTSKTINTRFKGTFGGNENWTEGVFVQGADSFTFSGYQKGVYTGGSFENAVYSAGQLLNNALGANINTIALGDGAVYANLSNVFGNEDPWTQTGLSEGWNGDSTVIDATAAASWILLANAGTIPAATGTDPTIKSSMASVDTAFTVAQTYDCAEAAEATVSIPSGLNAASSCGMYQLGHQWVDCWSQIEKTPDTCSSTICANFQGEYVAACNACFPYDNSTTAECLSDICNAIPEIGQANCNITASVCSNDS